MIYFESDYVVVSWDPEIQAVIAVWNGYLDGLDKVRTGHAKIIELAEQQKATKWLNDLRNLKVVDRADQEWLSKELPPLLHKAGIRFAATVIPQSPTAQLSNRNILRNLKEGEFAKETFSSLEEAKAWLCAE